MVSLESSIAGVSFETQEALPVILVDNQFATAKVTLYGANVLSFMPKVPANMSDLLWVSPAAVFNGQKPVRGGIPICWPWFGKHPVDSTLPAHGFVRNLLWQLDSARRLDSGATELVLSVESSDKMLKVWPFPFHLTLTVTVAETLSLSLCTTNLSGTDMVITEAFHSYFRVSHANQLTVLGLENSMHIDTLSGMDRCLQTEKLFLSPPIDSIFLNHASEVIIEDSGFSRRISIAKQNSISTVVWNPGEDIVKGFQDIPNDQWHTFVCVESGNVLDNAVTLKPNEKHCLSMQLSGLLY